MNIEDRLKKYIDDKVYLKFAYTYMLGDIARIPGDVSSYIDECKKEFYLKEGLLNEEKNKDNVLSPRRK